MPKLKAVDIGVILYWLAILVCARGCLAHKTEPGSPFWVALATLTPPWSMEPWWFEWTPTQSGGGAGLVVTLGVWYALANSAVIYAFAHWIHRRSALNP